MAQHRTYEDIDYDDQEFTVFIAHGHSQDWRIIERLINKDLDFATVVIQEDYRPGDSISKKVEKGIRRCEAFVAIMSADDQMAEGNYRARQNVIYELGYARGVLKKKQIILLVEKSVEVQSDISGLIYIPYKKDSVETVYRQLKDGLENIYDRFDENGEF